MDSAESEGAASHYVHRALFGRTYRLRNGLLAGKVIALADMPQVGVAPEH
jgi:hypothetical protein